MLNVFLNLLRQSFSPSLELGNLASLVSHPCPVFPLFCLPSVEVTGELIFLMDADLNFAANTCAVSTLILEQPSSPTSRFSPENIYHELMLTFDKCLFYICWNDHAIYVLDPFT